MREFVEEHLDHVATTSATRTHPRTGYVRAFDAALGPQAMDEIASFVTKATGHAIRKTSRAQSLWGGYGELSRIELVTRETVILKHVRPPRAPHAPEAARSHARKCRSYDVESAFYRSYASRTTPACRVPRTIAVSATNEGWLLLLEDLDAAGFALRRTGRRASEIAPCVRWLAAFHARFLGEDAHDLWPEGSYWHLATRPDELARVPELRDVAPLLDRALGKARFQTLVHGDAKPANFCFGRDSGCANSTVAAVDFQYVGRGCGMKDVAYLLHDTGTAAEQRALLDLYFATLREFVPSTVDFAALEDEWRTLHPVACADFVRFLAGWAPGSYDDRGRAIVRAAVTALTSR